VIHSESDDDELVKDEMTVTVTHHRQVGDVPGSSFQNPETRRQVMHGGKSGC